MTTKREYLHRMIVEVRRWAEWHGGEGLGSETGASMGSVPAKAETREAFEKRAEAIRRAKRKALQESLDRNADETADGAGDSPTRTPEQTTRSDGGGTEDGALETDDSEAVGEQGEGPALWSESQLGSCRPGSGGGQQQSPNAEASNSSGGAGANRGGGSGGGGGGEPKTNAEKLQWLRDYMGDCQRCPLGKNRTNLVFGEGDPEADIVFVGEAPGAKEDATGRPFVGPAGQLLNEMINAMGLERDDTYICNVLKSRPPDNRDPRPDEVAECFPFLQKQLEIIGPGAIVTLGRPATQTLLETDDALGALRGRWHTWKGISLMPTYHPAYLLRSPDQKRKTWNDLQQVIDKLGLPGPNG